MWLTRSSHTVRRSVKELQSSETESRHFLSSTMVRAWRSATWIGCSSGGRLCVTALVMSRVDVKGPPP